MADERDTNPKISRRRAIQRGTIIGAGVWMVPTISSIRLPAHAQVGSPMPEPTPTPTTPTPIPTETATPAPSPTPTPTTEVGGVKIVDGGLAETGRNVTAHAVAGGGLVVLGAGLKKIATNHLADHAAAEDPSPGS